MAPKKTRSDAELLYLTVQHLGRQLRDVDAGSGISGARFAVLVHLAFHEVNNVGELAAAEHVSRPAMTRLLQDMEKSGLVRRSADARDGRGVLVELTPKGRSTMKRVRTEKISLVARRLSPLPPSSRRQVKLALEALLKA
jgi:DNA-binding MarR family transcriptional regulator